MRRRTLATMLLCTSLIAPCVVRADGVGTASPTTLRAEDFGVLGDGVTDDGPAIARLMDAARATASPVLLTFPSDKTFYVQTAPERYVFDLDRAASLTLDGGGSTFLLDPELRCLRLTNSTDIVIRRFNVDFSPLPFADGIVVAVNAEERYLDVALLPGVPLPPTGGTIVEPHDQPFFGMLWHDGAYGSLSRHYWTDLVEPGPDPGSVRVHAGSYGGVDFNAFSDIEPGKWRISIPVPGIAHRYGPGQCFQIGDNDSVTLEDVELWSAPWFGFGISRNSGTMAFRRVHIRPKPGSGRLMSIWRDGFHVKGNSASMLWEDCILSGMNDDAFNISTHSSAVHQVPSPTRITVHQKFPLLPMPWREGAILTAADATAQRLLGTAKILKVEVGPEPPLIEGHRAAPDTTLELDRPIPGLEVGTMVWDPATSNPDTTLRGCRIEMSCRLQSPVVMEDCDVTGLVWFYGEHIEGAFPHHVTVRDCTFRPGRGNPTIALSFSGAPKPEAASPAAGAPPRVIHDVVVENNDFWGTLSVRGVENIRIAHNRFHEPHLGMDLSKNHEIEIVDNRDVDADDAEPSFLLGLAGAPISLLGPLDAPRFEELFSELHESGFNVFFPTFITQENEAGVKGSGHEAYFFGEAPPVPNYATSPLSPYRAAQGKIKILVPAYVFVTEDEWIGEIDQAALRARYERFKTEFLGEDTSVLLGFQNFDEPSSMRIAPLFEGKSVTNLANLHTVRRILRDVFGDLPVFIVEGAIPFVIKTDPGLRAVREFVEKHFWEGVRDTVDAGDWYGFDLYPVDTSPDLDEIGKHVRLAVETAPGKKIVSVLQGFGRTDLGGEGRRPTFGESRFMAYDSIINGADGLIWWGQSAMDIEKDPAHWNAMLSIAREIREISPILALPDAEIVVDNAAVEVLAKRADATLHILAANASANKASFSFAVPLCPSATGASYRVTDLFSGEELVSGELDSAPNFSDSLEAFGVRGYTITYK